MALRSVALSPKLGKKFLLTCLRTDKNSVGKYVRLMSMTSGSGGDGSNRNSKGDMGSGTSRFEIPPSVEGYQGGEHEFSHNQSLECLSAAVEYHFKARKSSSIGDTIVDDGSAAVDRQADHEFDNDSGGKQEYDNSGHVSLSSCMQTTVPEPFTTAGRSPVHLNMPKQGRTLSQQKYVADKLENMHPSRQFSTSAPSFGAASTEPQSMQGDYESVPCPQGIQGDDCVQFQLWLDSCRRYGLANCEDQLQGIQTGRKTLAQVLVEQEELIKKIAEEYRNTVASDHVNSAELGELDLDGPCPQGIQGDDCERFKVWFRNCQQFGFGDCTDQLQGIQGGRKSLSQVFKEQDDMIRSITKKFYSTSSGKVGMGGVRVTRSFSTGPDSQEKSPDSNTDSSTRIESLSQKERLKRAVKDYGATVIVFHVGISLMSLGGFYLLVSSGIDVVSLMSKIGVGESFVKSQVVTGASTFVIAYAVHKVFAPVRIAITLTSTPFIVRYLRGIGFLKTPKAVQK